MTLSDFAAFSTAISGLAVTASLIYLAKQTYQSSKHTKALLQQGQSNRVATSLLAMANADLANAWITGNDGTATSESVKSLQFAQLCNMIEYDMMDFHNTHIDGLTSDEQFGSACVAYSNLLQQPGMGAFWTTWKDAPMRDCPRFIDWVDGLASKRTAGSHSNWVWSCVEWRRSHTPSGPPATLVHAPPGALRTPGVDLN
jgi:hypothetical protein